MPFYRASAPHAGMKLLQLTPQQHFLLKQGEPDPVQVEMLQWLGCAQQRAAPWVHLAVSCALARPAATEIYLQSMTRAKRFNTFRVQGIRIYLVLGAGVILNLTCLVQHQLPFLLP